MLETVVLDRRRRLHDLDLLLLVQVVDDDLEHEAVELRLGERVRPFELDRILRREDEERLLQRVAPPLDGDAMFLHRLEER